MMPAVVLVGVLSVVLVGVLSVVLSLEQAAAAIARATTTPEALRRTELRRTLAAAR